MWGWEEAKGELCRLCSPADGSDGFQGISMSQNLSNHTLNAEVYCTSIMSIKLLQTAEMGGHQLGTKPFWPWGGTGKGFRSSGGWDLLELPFPYSRGWELGGGEGRWGGGGDQEPVT